MLCCCNNIPKFDAQSKIFHAFGASGGIGTIYFSLYRNHKYKICESGGIDEICYYGTYDFFGDTILLHGLSNNSYLKYNRLLISRYAKQDSSYWKWKNPNHADQWAVMRESDLAMGNSGNVHQLGNDNKPVLDPTYHFVINFDTLFYQPKQPIH